MLGGQVVQLSAVGVGVVELPGVVVEVAPAADRGMGGDGLPAVVPDPARSERLVDCDLYVTLEPCTMCAGAISLARIRRLYYGAADPKGGAVDSGVRFFASPTCHHIPEVYSAVGERGAATLLRDFFKSRR